MVWFTTVDSMKVTRITSHFSCLSVLPLLNAGVFFRSGQYSRNILYKRCGKSALIALWYEIYLNMNDTHYQGIFSLKYRKLALLAQLYKKDISQFVSTE